MLLCFLVTAPFLKGKYVCKIIDLTDLYFSLSMAWSNIFVMTIYPRLHQDISLQLTVSLQMFHNLVNILVVCFFIYNRSLGNIHIIIFACCFFSLLFFNWSIVNTVLQLKKMKRDRVSIVLCCA